jgi:hypothetical protein
MSCCGNCRKYRANDEPGAWWGVCIGFDENPDVCIDRLPCRKFEANQTRTLSPDHSQRGFAQIGSAESAVLPKKIAQEGLR